MKSLLNELAAKSEALEARRKATKQQQLQLTYSVGDWVLCKTNWGGPRNARSSTGVGPRLIARVESATPIETEGGTVWAVRCYYSPDRKMSVRGWGKRLEHRHVDRALNPAEISDLRRANIIPPAGSVLP